MPKALVVEDDRSSMAALLELVEHEGFDGARRRERSAPPGRCSRRAAPAVVLTDMVLPDGSGLDLIEAAAAIGAQVVLITGHASVETAVEALRRGATDYLTKPIDLPRLKAILANVGRTRELQAEIGSLRGELRKLGRFGPLVGASPSMGVVYDLIARVAPTDATVFIVGESGTGKEVVAQAVHELSRRRKEPFVPVNCGAVSPNLIESTLFGHEKGSFTGAERMHRGVFEQATGGTLFLDEVSEMPVELQVKLLRVLETGTVMRIGGEKAIAVDVRVIAATNRVPEQAVAGGQAARGSVVPAERVSDRAAAAARAGGGHRGAGGAFSERAERGRADAQALEHGGAGGAAALRVAGQRARAEEPGAPGVHLGGERDRRGVSAAGGRRRRHSVRRRGRGAARRRGKRSSARRSRCGSAARWPRSSSGSSWPRSRPAAATSRRRPRSSASA